MGDDELTAEQLLPMWHSQARSIDRLERQLADTRAILSDLLSERGESWLAQLVGRQSDVLGAMSPTPGCLVCNGYDWAHNRLCTVAEMRRAVGGPLETQRQVDAAHEAAAAYSYDDTARMLRGPSDFLARYGGARLDFGPRDNRNHATINELIQSGRISLDDARWAIEGAPRYTATITGDVE